MTSWFSSAGLDLNSALDTLTTTVQSVTESVSEAIPTEHKEFLAKITLNTDEMISERQTFSEEATKKAKAKDLLNKILPWETLDAEREVRVCVFFCTCLFSVYVVSHLGCFGKSDFGGRMQRSDIGAEWSRGDLFWAV